MTVPLLNFRRSSDITIYQPQQQTRPADAVSVCVRGGIPALVAVIYEQGLPREEEVGWVGPGWPTGRTERARERVKTTTERVRGLTFTAAQVSQRERGKRPRLLHFYHVDLFVFFFGNQISSRVNDNAPSYLLYISLYISQACLHSSRTCRATMTLVPHHDSQHIAAILFKSAVHWTSLENCNASMLSVSTASWRCRDIIGSGRGGHRGHRRVTTSTFFTWVRKITPFLSPSEVRERILFMHWCCVHWQWR